MNLFISVLVSKPKECVSFALTKAKASAGEYCGERVSRHLFSNRDNFPSGKLLVMTFFINNCSSIIIQALREKGSPR